MCAVRIGCLLSFNEGSREASEREFDRVFGAEQQHTARSLSLAYARDASTQKLVDFRKRSRRAIRRMFVLLFFSERGRKIGGRPALSRRATVDDALVTRCECVQRFYDGGFVLGVCVRASLAEIDDRPFGG